MTSCCILNKQVEEHSCALMGCIFTAQVKYTTFDFSNDCNCCAGKEMTFYYTCCVHVFLCVTNGKSSTLQKLI